MAQNFDAYREDFSFWSSLQLEKKIFSNQFIGVQYQLRLHNNATTYDRSNVYFNYGININKRITTELVYQINANHRVNQYTVRGSLTYKMPLSNRFHVYGRTSVQHMRNHFTGEYGIDKPFYQWRNRLRLIYKLNKKYAISLSAEPYLTYSSIRPVYLSRVRYMGQFTVKLDKFQQLSVFHIIQPDVITYGKPDVSYVLGFTYQVSLNQNFTKFRKRIWNNLFHHESKDDDENQTSSDSFN
jgi:hypothetical protein